MAVLSPTDTQDHIAAMSDEGLTEALILSMMSTQDADPFERAHAGDRMHALRDEAQRRQLKLFAAP
jgi:hypothetical protein